MWSEKSIFLARGGGWLAGCVVVRDCHALIPKEVPVKYISVLWPWSLRMTEEFASQKRLRDLIHCYVHWFSSRCVWLKLKQKQGN